MPQFLVAIHHPENFTPDQESEETKAAITALNKEMKAAGIVQFVGGLKSQKTSKSMWKHKDGRLRVTDGPYLETKEYIGGFWVLDCTTLDEAVAWGQKASEACGVPVEVRGFW